MTHFPADPLRRLGPCDVVHGDALALPLDDESVDLVVTSPPYFALRSYQDDGEHYGGQLGSESKPTEFVDNLIAATREMMRVLKPSGSIWVNLGDKYGRGSRTTSEPQNGVRTGSVPGRVIATAHDKSLMGLPWRYALRCIDDLGLILRAEVIWSKPNGLPESVTDRVRRSHEQWFHFTRQPRYYSAVDEIREAHAPASLVRYRTGYIEANNKSGRRDQGGNVDYPDGMVSANPLGKLPGSVREVPSQPLKVPDHLGVDHFAAFPVAWPLWIIRAWSPVDGIVLDPFGGTGTTALAARALGRHGITVDLSRDYCRLAEWRVTDPGELARTRGVDKPPPEPDGQVSLFGEGAA